MIRNSRRMVALAVAGAVAIAPVISGCGAGMDAQSAAPTRLTEGVNVSVPLDGTAPQIQLRNMFVLGPEPGAAVPPGTSLPLYGVLIHQVQGEQDRLVSVSSPAFASARIDGGGITLPPAASDGTGSMTKLLGETTASPSPTAGQTTQPGNGQQNGGQETGTATPEPTGPGATSSPDASPTSGNTASPQQSPPTQAAGEEQPRVVLTGLNEELLAGTLITVRMQFEQAGAVEFRVPLISQQGEYATYPLATPNGQASGSPGATDGAQSPGQQSPGTESPGTEPAQPGTSPSPTGAQSPGAAGH
ncbi:hypothetical protein ACN3XK_09155 [Actinomadura welshii]